MIQKISDGNCQNFEEKSPENTQCPVSIFLFPANFVIEIIAFLVDVGQLSPFQR
jgi:hypothetical protein